MRGQEGGRGIVVRLLAGAVGVVVAGGLLAALSVHLARPPATAARGGSAAASRAAAVASPTPRPTADDVLAKARAIGAPAAPPVRLVIPAIGVDAAVEAVGLDGQGRMGAPSATSEVGWYRAGVAPGDAGNALVDGHLDWTSGPAVFWELGRLRTGDRVTVARADGSEVQFVVDSTSVVAFDAADDTLFTATGPPSMSLITCTGTWDRARATYLQRLVVHATLAPGDPIRAP